MRARCAQGAALAIEPAPELALPPPPPPAGDARVSLMGFDVRGLGTVWVGGRLESQMHQALPDRPGAEGEG